MNGKLKKFSSLTTARQSNILRQFNRASEARRKAIGKGYGPKGLTGFIKAKGYMVDKENLPNLTQRLKRLQGY